MSKKFNLSIIVGIMLVLLLLPILSAEQQSLGTFKKNTCVNLVQSCSNCTYVNISSVLYPNSSKIIGEVSMTKTGTGYNYTFCNTTIVGSYIVNGHGDSNGADSVWVYDFFINGVGEELTSQKTSFYLGIIILLIFFFILSIIIINVLPTNDTRDDSGALISINNLKYLRYPIGMVAWGMLVFISYLVMGLAEAYFTIPLMGQIFRVIFTILLASAMVGIPVIFFFMFAKFMQDQVIKRMIERNIYTE